MTIAVTGATGQLGRLIVAGLKSRPNAGDIIALTRSTAKAADLGIAVREADYDRPETLGSALAGIDTLIFVSGSDVGKRIAQHRNLVDAAVAAGVGHIAYTSILHADTSKISLAEEHRATEAAIRASNIPFTLLRNGWYTENYTALIPTALEHGGFIGSARNGRIAAASRADYAEAAIAVATTAGHAGKIYELAGDTAFTMAELAAEVSRQTGKDVPYHDMPASDYANALVAAGLPKPLAEAIASWDVAAADGALFDDSRTLSKLIGHPTTPLPDTIAAALK